MTSPYNPYPPDIFPGDLNSEVERVLREVDLVENRALARWHALALPIVRGQPPTLQNTGTEVIETLGKLMNFDKNMSPNKNRACVSCHMPYAGFSGPIPSVNLTMIAYPGSDISRRQADSAEIHLCALFPRAQLQPNPGPFLRRKFLGFPRTGYLLWEVPTPSRRNILPSIPMRTWASRILPAWHSALPGRVQTSV